MVARKLHLRQVVLYEGRAVGLLIWTTCSRKLAGREAFIGWDARTREKRLGWIVQNSRFLLLPEQRPANLASRILGMAIKVLLQAWEVRHGKRPLLAETFVDPEGYKGTCYHASGWTRLGSTKGYPWRALHPGHTGSGKLPLRLLRRRNPSPVHRQEKRAKVRRTAHLYD